MKKLLVLAPFFFFAACSAINVDVAKQASAEETGGWGGAGSSSTGSTGGGSQCSCPSPDGERLKAKYVVGADGSWYQVNMWHDTALNDECFYQSLPNGETRCTPPAPVWNAYIDSACTKPIYIYNNTCAPVPKYVHIDKFGAPEGTCAAPVTSIDYYTVDTGAPINGPINWYGIDPDGTCDAKGMTPTGAKLYDMYWLYDVSWFVEAKQGVGF
jgi:hypothetical protein